jgi:adenylate kinase
MGAPRLVLLGKQGAGKGTQGKRLAEHYDVPHLSTGEMFRAQSSAGTAFGLEAKRYMDSGELVPDDVVVGVIEECLAPGGPTEIVLDRLAGRRVCGDCQRVYHVNMPPKHNWTCDDDGGKVEQRPDDSEEAVMRRLELYDIETVPIIDFYRQQSHLVVVDGVGEGDDVFERIVEAVEKRRADS